MTALDNSAKFQTALESNHHLSKALVNEALCIHGSKDIATTESQIASEFQKDPVNFVKIHQGLEAAINGDQAKSDPQFAASLYRDVAVMDQAVARLWMGKDTLGAGVMLGNESMSDPYNAKNAIAKAEKLDPANKDLPQLHLIQNDLAGMAWPDKTKS